MNEGEKIGFGVLHESGEFVETKTLPKSAIFACPHLMLVPEHYRDDGICRCNDITHIEMEEWGYTWDGESWQ